MEGLALIRKKIAPTILTLMSPLKKVVETQWYYLDDPSLEMVYELEKYCVENADGVMAISQAIKDTIGDLYDIAWDNLPSKAHQEVIPLGVEQSIVTKKVTAKEDGKVDILFVGRFERRKGIEELTAAIALLLKEKTTPFEFHFIGNIPDENGKFIYKDFLKKYSKESWIKRVKKYGYVSDEELRDMYAKCDIFVAPSRYESFGLIFIEAMASGKPVIGTRVGGIPEIIIEGQNGLLFTNENTKELQVALSKLITDKPLRERMGKESKKLIETKFNSEKMATDFTSFANKLIKKL